MHALDTKNKPGTEDVGAPATTRSSTLAALLSLAALLLGGTFALGGFYVAFSRASTNFEEVALGQATTSLFATVNGHRIHCMDARDAELCLKGARARKAGELALWLGNSQLHAVNQLKPGETNAPALLHSELLPRGAYLMAFSQPNANLQEHLVVFEYARSQVPINQLVLPVVFDDTREDGLRKQVADLLREDNTREQVGRSEIGTKLVAQSAKNGSDPDTAGIERTIQEKAERSLTGWLREHSALWRLREQARGQFFLQLYQLRNFVFGIKPETKRRAIPGRLRDNLAALDALLESAAASGTRTIVYVAPIRDDVPIPYVPAEYERFKREVRELCAKHGVSFHNLESLIPAEYWGTKASTSAGGVEEIDFMHFQAPGHQMLADQLAGSMPRGDSVALRRRP